MASLSERVYWQVPYVVKRAMASVNARRLDRERFGAEYTATLASLRQRESWTRQQFEEHQRRELPALVREAAANVPYYRRLFSSMGVSPGDIRTLDELRKLPILEKETVRAEGLGLVSDRLPPARRILVHTSGTTGTPLTLYRDRATNAAAFAYLDARWHAVAGMRRRRNRSVSMGGNLVAAPARTRPPFWVYNRRWDQLYMSSYHLSEENMRHYDAALRRFRPEYLEGYPSSLHALARYILDRGLAPIPAGACFTTAETLYDHQREAIQTAFACRVYDQYGCGEFAVFAAECAHGSMHLSPEVGVVEVLDAEDRPVPDGTPGNLICTGLINRAQPFVRYRLGDMGALETTACPCGSALPRLGRIEGRTDAVLLTRDGRRVGRLDPVFKGAKGIREAQVVQEDWTVFRIRIAPASGYSAATGERVRANLSHRLGPDCNVVVELVDRIERTRAGKFPAVVCRLTAAAARLPVEGSAGVRTQEPLIP